ncbi:PEP-CTERM sorting domain-containing protein [Massilia phosphatilytica]
MDGHTVSYEVTRHQGQQHYLARAALLGGEDEVCTSGFGWDDADANYVEAFAYVYTYVAADSFVPTLDFADSFTAFIAMETPSFDRFYVTGPRGNAYFGGDVQVVKVVGSNSTDLPEPASMALLGAGVLGLVALRRRGTR